MKLKHIPKLVLTEDEKITLNRATSILADICDIYDVFCCKGCPLETICKHHTSNIANVLDSSLDGIEVE